MHFNFEHNILFKYSDEDDFRILTAYIEDFQHNFILNIECEYDDIKYFENKKSSNNSSLSVKDIHIVLKDIQIIYKTSYIQKMSVNEVYVPPIIKMNIIYGDKIITRDSDVFIRKLKLDKIMSKLY